MLHMYLAVLFSTYASLVTGQRFQSFAGVSLTNGLELRLQPYTNPGYCSPNCNDNPPPSGILRRSQYTCEQQKNFRQCHASFMEGFCECTCEKCCPCNNSPPPGSIFNCVQQRMFGKCNRGWMLGYCECECGRCPAVFEEEEQEEEEEDNRGSTDNGDGDDEDNEEESNGDSADNGDDEDEDGEEDTPTPTPTPLPQTKTEPVPTPTPTPSASVDTRVAVNGEVEENGDDEEEEEDEDEEERECEGDEVPIPESRPFRCESARCARSRARCANRCDGGFLGIEFECKMVKKGNSMASSTSCACAGV
eukprot:TRINITY_DN654_c1_g3_i1.p1 TRINITY_DN654_c1_g3~~TRINITY_DN654_c1_g3_i1.p1  ORF type:complete len:306 (-),score=68.79 TRINITY_DN654_c1_g3_i1:39-956(-)